jgi:hypothetical protein
MDEIIHCRKCGKSMVLLAPESGLREFYCLDCHQSYPIDGSESVRDKAQNQPRQVWP